MMTKVVYQITYPNGKVYVGMDLTNSINYFGSASDKLIEKDFSHETRQKFTITRDILWSSDDAKDSDVRQIERKLICELGANDPARGYNRWPRLRGQDITS